MKVEYTFRARQDLRELYEYIAYTLQSPIAARGTADRIMETVRSLASMPKRNPLYKDEPWRSRGVRFVPVKNYLVFYMVNDEEEIVSVARILYGGRDISRQLEESGEQ